MKCNWCGEGEGNNHTLDKNTGRVMYYYCDKCVGTIKKELKISVRFIKDKKGIKAFVKDNSNEYGTYGFRDKETLTEIIENKINRIWEMLL